MNIKKHKLIKREKDKDIQQNESQKVKDEETEPVIEPE